MALSIFYIQTVDISPTTLELYTQYTEELAESVQAYIAHLGSMKIA